VEQIIGFYPYFYKLPKKLLQSLGIVVYPLK